MITIETPETNLEAIASLSWRDSDGELHTKTKTFTLDRDIVDEVAEDSLYELFDGIGGAQDDWDEMNLDD